MVPRSPIFCGDKQIHAIKKKKKKKDRRNESKTKADKESA